MGLTYRLGIDVGGTFTDLVAFNEDNGEVLNYKVPTTTKDPVKGVMDTLKEFLSVANAEDISLVIHATTIAANALLGQVGLELPKIALVTTNGFKDVIEIGRQRRPELYNLYVQRPKPLVPRYLRFEVKERIGPRGEVWEPLDEESAREVAKRIRENGVESIALCLLYSYINPSHEARVKEILREENPEAYLSVSSEVVPEYREFERSSTTVVNAALMPIVSSYTASLRESLNSIGVSAPLRIMQSNGGVVGEALVRITPMSIVESGPAAGVIASAFYGRKLGIRNIISFDMGGTTAKAGMIRDGEAQVVAEYEVAGKVHSGRIIKGSGYPVRFPFIDLAECSAGGGTIAWVDEGGALRVGPLSAGAEPGPACYGKGGKDPTVTDANLLLGRLDPDYFIGGRMKVSRELAEVAMREKVCDKVGLSLLEAAQGVIRIVDSIMAKTLRIVSVERGHDPRDFSLIAFGGAGPMHVCKLAEELDITRIVVPPNPGLFSAYGLLAADFTHSLVRSVLIRADEAEPEKLDSIYLELTKQGEAMLESEGVPRSRMKFIYQADLRYLGQAYELTVPIEYPIGKTELEKGVKEFHKRHKALYGYDAQEEQVEVVNLRLVAKGLISKPPIKERELKESKPPKDALTSRRMVYFEAEGGYMNTPIYLRERLLAGNKIEGPAIIEQFDSTTVVEPSWSVMVDGYLNLAMRRD